MGDSEDEIPFNKSITLYDILTTLKDTYGFSERDIGTLYAEFILSEEYRQTPSGDNRASEQAQRERARTLMRKCRDHFFDIQFELERGSTTKQKVLPSTADLESRIHQPRIFESMDRKVKNLYDTDPPRFHELLGGAVLTGAREFSEKYGSLLPPDRYSDIEYRSIRNAVDKARSQTRRGDTQ